MIDLNESIKAVLAYVGSGVPLSLVLRRQRNVDQGKERNKTARVAAHNAEFELRERDNGRATWLLNLRQPAPHKNGKR